MNLDAPRTVQVPIWFGYGAAHKVDFNTDLLTISALRTFVQSKDPSKLRDMDAFCQDKKGLTLMRESLRHDSPEFLDRLFYLSDCGATIDELNTECMKIGMRRATKECPAHGLFVFTNLMALAGYPIGLNGMCFNMSSEPVEKTQTDANLFLFSAMIHHAIRIHRWAMFYGETELSGGVLS